MVERQREMELHIVEGVEATLVDLHIVPISCIDDPLARQQWAQQPRCKNMPGSAI